MPRGQRKSLEEKIQAKQELINALNIRMESEQRELEELFEQKKRKELEAVSDIIEDAGLAPEEVTEVLQQYIAVSYTSRFSACCRQYHNKAHYPSYRNAPSRRFYS